MLASAAAALAASATLAQPQQNGQYDIVPFRVTDTSAEFSIRYDLDDWRYYNPGPDTFVRTPMWQEELSLRARGYVYHPALLDWTVEGCPLLVQYAYDSDQCDSSGSETLFNRSPPPPSWTVSPTTPALTMTFSPRTPKG